ncbi:hypothetical protein WN51_09472 [Melipona quadrifasciata]|uniref:Uncharacterized protein n=1 Tax=Melipona quadrifasciata TaxID=166423 RepID=A0A0M9A8J1_9HYME|nr:hypothetical protein WN51_09472 [Melipona quadrifasciata]
MIKLKILLQHYENTTETTVFLDLSITEVPTLIDSTSLKMLEDITAKVWRILPVTNIPRNWVLAYCMKYTEISEDVEKAKIRCQYGGIDWDCTFIELGGGQDDFNIGKIVSLFHNLSNNELRLKLLRAAEVCGKLWQKYKQDQNKRLIRMRLNVRVKNREKRFSKKYKDTRASRKRKKNLRRKKKKERDEEIKKKRRAAKKVQAIRKNLSNKITELENKKTLSPKEEVELNRLRLTMILQICLKDTMLLDKLQSHINDCNNYPCMFSKIIQDKAMKSIVSIIRNDTMDDTISKEFKQSIQDCSVWWKLFKYFDKNAHARRELGRCLFQTFSFKCRELVLDKVRLLLITTEEQ